MKKIVLNVTLVAFLVLSSSVVSASEKKPITVANTPTSEVPAEVRSLMNRLEEIKDMDKTNLESSEKKELRREVREIKRELRGKGIYLSTGAIIIIVLLILLL